jgi:hypothetical protein
VRLHRQVAYRLLEFGLRRAQGIVVLVASAEIDHVVLFGCAARNLSGEATRVSGNERSGVASAYGARGTYMNCEYRMTTPYQGTGSCRVSTGALYQVHIGV